MKIFITGATGYIGREVARGLALCDHQIIALARSDESAMKLEALGYEIIRGDITKPDEWVEQASKAEAFIHCAQIRAGKRITMAWVKEASVADKKSFTAILQAARLNKNTKVVIYTSGISVVGDYGSQKTNEQTPVKQSFTVGSYHHETEKIANEAATQGLPVVIIRPSLPVSSDGNFAEFFLKPAQKGKLQFVGKGNNYWPVVHMSDLVNGYRKVIENPPISKTIIFSDDKPLIMKEFSDLLMQQFGYKKAKSVPKWIVSFFAGKPLANMLVSSYRVSNDSAKELLGWKPRFTTFNEALLDIMSNFKEDQ